MKVTGVELRRVSIPYLRPFRSALGTDAFRELLLVRVVTPEGEGWGECAALAAPRYTEEYVDGAHRALRDHLVPLLVAAGGDVRAAGVAGVLAPVRGHRMAKAALETALLDAELRAAGVCLADHLGATATTVHAGVAVGMAASVAEVLDAVEAAVAEGYRRVKLKIAPGWDVEPVSAVRERFGDDLVLQADANSAYRLDDAPALAALDPFALAMVEQPLAAGDLVGHARLASLIATPICLDESVTSADAAATAIALGAAAVVNVKPGRVGGYLEAVRVHDVCRDAGVAAWVGGMFESGVARAANLALAALPGFTLPGDLCPPARYLAGDLAGPLIAVGGRLAVPRTPGAGAPLSDDALREFTTSVEHLRTFE